MLFHCSKWKAIYKVFEGPYILLKHAQLLLGCDMLRGPPGRGHNIVEETCHSLACGRPEQTRQIVHQSQDMLRW